MFELTEEEGRAILSSFRNCRQVEKKPKVIETSKPPWVGFEKPEKRLNFVGGPDWVRTESVNESPKGLYKPQW